jgi:hypothetical protein
MHRAILILAAVWTLLCVPALCMGGLLTHACECGASLECGHEDACATDPCSELAGTSPGKPAIPAAAKLQLTVAIAPPSIAGEPLACGLSDRSPFLAPPIDPLSLCPTLRLPLLI